jgi:drug/metabolite transporter (DMT)-like permease
MPDAGPFGPASVVVFGLIGAAAWGAADFGGGLASRRAALFGVALASQVVGMVAAFLLARAWSEPAPTSADLGWGALAGVLGAAGILGLYGGLAVGRMSVVAPVTGVLAAMIPVLVGIILEGVPPPLVVIGIGLAVVAVVLVSRVRDDRPGRSGIELALVGGVALGLTSVALSRIDGSVVFGGLTAMRVAEGATIAAAILLTRRPARVPIPVLPAVGLIGLLDMTGNAGFVMANATGELAVAAVLTSLYPVGTVVLAAVFLRESVNRSHAAGIVLALAAIVLIAFGARAA